MLKPDVDRLDYGEQLNPPDGFELDVAIASTYSLDLNALLAVPIALCFNETLDGDLEGEKLALFEAIGRLKDKLRVFYQKGNIAYPSTYNRLFTLLEPCLHPLIPNAGAFSSYHPKFWLLRYIESDRPIKTAKVSYRLIVLSRNLTFDRSWDVALSLDGGVGTKKYDDKNAQWNEFIKSLISQDKEFKAGYKIIKELECLEWKSPEIFDDVSLFVGGKSYGRPVSIESDDNDALMVVSPFIKSTDGGVTGLDWLSQFCPSNEKYLFSRAEELNMIGVDKLSDWQCFSMNENIVKGEELHEVNNTLAGEYSKSQNLHAKIIIHQKGKKVYWHLGSANATAAALGDDKSDPRNTEVMIKLEGHCDKIGPNILKDQWVTDKPESSLFVKHEFENTDQDVTNKISVVLRHLEYQLVRADWILECKATQDDNYSLCLSVNPIEPLANGVKVRVGQLAIVGNKGKQDISSKMYWEDMHISNISALIPVEIAIEHDGVILEKRLVIEANVNIEGGDFRHQFILKSLVDTPDKVMSYLRLLLQVNPDKNEWSSQGKGHRSGADTDSILSGEPIFEQLLMASSRHPKLLIRIAKLIGELKSSGVDFPTDFADLWTVFGKGIKS